uniref:Uncharacterized protein n=1 Tax=Arundo donax TaxID=35708 RepID=A0A0A9FIP7_ARUDO
MCNSDLALLNKDLLGSITRGMLSGPSFKPTRKYNASILQLMCSYHIQYTICTAFILKICA